MTAFEVIRITRPGSWKMQQQTPTVLYDSKHDSLRDAKYEGDVQRYADGQ